MTRKILVLDAHPVAETLTGHLTRSYAHAAKTAGHSTRFRALSGLKFDPDFGMTKYRNAKDYEPDLEALMQDLEWSDHFVIAVPMWWGGLPARTKGLIDRLFIPGRGFDTRNVSKIGIPAPLLTGKTARVIVTADTPALFQALVYRNAYQIQLKKQILGFNGIKPTRISWVSGAGTITEKAVKRWDMKLKKRARKGI